MDPIKSKLRVFNRWLICITVDLIFLLTSTALAQTHSWTRVNPGGGGAFSTIEAGPSGIVLAGSDLSGVYISLNLAKVGE